MMIFTIILIALSVLCLIVGLLEGKSWQKTLDLITLSGIICFAFRMPFIAPKQAVISAIIILVISIVLAIYQGIDNAVPETNKKPK